MTLWKATVRVFPGQGEIHLFFHVMLTEHRAPQVGGDRKPSPGPTLCEKQNLGGFPSTLPSCVWRTSSDGDSLNCSKWKKFLPFIKMKNFPCGSGVYCLQNN